MSISRKKGIKRKIWAYFLLIGALIVGLLTTQGKALEIRKINGVVFKDDNQNLLLDPGEEGIAKVCVSNGRHVVQTDQTGRYDLPLHEGEIIFVVKPSKFALPLNQNNVPQFYYIYQPDGSPRAISEYKGIEPTGKFPDYVNFPLFKTEEADTFQTVILGDTQVGNHEEIRYLRDSIISDIKGIEAAFAISMGDNVNDALNLYDRYTEVMGEIDMPIFYVPGNHDLNYDSPNEQYQYETYKRFFGPTYYSFNYGKVHFVVLEDVKWNGRNYRGELGEKQLEWLKNDLSYIPKDQLVVLNMHIPLISWVDRKAEKHQVADREKLFNLLKNLENVLALAGHTHTVEHILPGEEFEGWRSELPIPEIIVGATCGSWWSDPFDEHGIPYSYMRDGVPRGYFIFQFNQNTYAEQYKAAGHPLEYQANISFLSGNLALSPFQEGILTSKELESVKVIANVFNSGADSVVTCQIDDLKPIPMKRKAVYDPYLINYSLGTEPEKSTHIWLSPLPASLGLGIHSVKISFMDRYGNTFQSYKLFEVWSSGA